MISLIADRPPAETISPHLNGIEKLSAFRLLRRTAFARAKELRHVGN
jgi:hypothetical protein